MSVKLKLGKFLPEKFVLKNESLLVAKMGEKIRANVESRLRRGQGATGSLPTSMSKTGLFKRSIFYQLRQDRKGNFIAVISAGGNRPASEVRGKKASASVRQKTARSEASQTGLYKGKKLGVAKARGKPRKNVPTEFGTKYKTGAVKVRAVTTNAALAAVLSVPPTAGDKRGRNGGRGVYVVFGENITDINDTVKIALAGIEAELQ